jgi:exodeoxyribonuclease VII small subunit
VGEEKKEIEFETALKKLEGIVENLETGDLSLEQALKQYEEGVRMADICSKRLTEAEKKVEVLMKTGGKLKAVPFSTESGEANTNEQGKNKKKR